MSFLLLKSTWPSQGVARLRRAGSRPATHPTRRLNTAQLLHHTLEVGQDLSANSSCVPIHKPLHFELIVLTPNLFHLCGSSRLTTRETRLVALHKSNKTNH